MLHCWMLEKKSMETAKKFFKNTSGKHLQVFGQTEAGICEMTVYHVRDELLMFNMRKWGRKGGRIKPDFSGLYVIQSSLLHCLILEGLL